MDFQDEIKKSLRTPEEAANAEIDAYVRYDIDRMKQMLKYVALSGEYEECNGCTVIRTVIESYLEKYCRVSFKEEIIRKGFWGQDFSTYQIATCNYTDMKLVDLYLRKLGEKAEVEGIKFEVFAAYYDRVHQKEHTCPIPGRMRIQAPGRGPVKICMKVSMTIK